MSLVDLHREQKAQAQTVQAAAFEGTVLNNPATTTSAIRVSIPVLSTKHDFGPCPWQARIVLPGDVINGITVARWLLPKKGDSALIVFDSDNQPWVVEWWPA